MAIQRFFRRILHLFGAPGDPIPFDDEGRSARLRLLRYIVIGLLHMVFGPWAPHSALNTPGGALLRRLITTVVRASLRRMTPAPKSKHTYLRYRDKNLINIYLRNIALSNNTINTMHFIAEVTPIKYRLGCLHEMYDQIITTGFVSATAVLHYSDVARLSDEVVNMLESMIVNPTTLVRILPIWCSFTNTD